MDTRHLILFALILSALQGCTVLFTSEYDLCLKDGHTRTECNRYYIERLERYRSAWKKHNSCEHKQP